MIPTVPTVADDDRISVTWTERVQPLDPVAVVGTGPSARALARRLLSDDDEFLVKRRAAGGTADCVLYVVADTTDELPWADGVVYVGRDPAAPSLLIPTMLEPSVPLPLVERSLRARFPLLAPPLVYVPLAGRVLTATAARPISRRVLTAWLAAWEAAAGKAL
jgi:hypothetical protein